MNRLTLISFGVLVLIIIILAVDNEYLRSKPVNAEPNKVLLAKIDSLSVINSSLEMKISKYESDFNQKEKRKTIKEKKIIDLKNTEDEKVFTVDTIGPNELYNVFAGFTPG